MAKRTSIFYNALLLTAANLMMRGVSMAFQVYLVGRIGAGGIGLLTLVNTVGMLIATIGSMGSRVATTCLVAEEHGFRRTEGVRRAMHACLLYALCTSTAIGLLTLRLSGWLASSWLKDLRTASSIRLLALTLPLSCIWSVFGSYFTATGHIGRLVAVQFADRLMDICFTAALLTFWAGNDVERSCLSITAGNAIGSALSVLLLFFLYRREQHRVNRSGGSEPVLKRLLHLTIPLTISDSLRAGLNTLEQFLIPWGLRHAGSTGEEAIASYGTIHGMVFPVLMFPACVLYAVADLLVPELSRSHAIGDNRRIDYVVQHCLRWGLIFAAVVSGILWLVADSLTEALYDSPDAGVFLRLFSPLVLLLYMDAIVDGMLKGLLQQVHSARFNTFTSILDVMFLYVLLPKLGISGFFLTFTVTHAVNFYLSVSRLLRVTDYSPRWGFLLRLLLSMLISCFLSMKLQSAVLMATGYVFLLAVLLRVTGAVDHQDASWLHGILRRRT